MARSKAECEALSQSCFAMPAVRNDATGQICSQTTAMCAKLGSELGYAPGPGLEFFALKIACDVADIW